jgi:hypothetical protein
MKTFRGAEKKVAEVKGLADMFTENDPEKAQR